MSDDQSDQSDQLETLRTEIATQQTDRLNVCKCMASLQETIRTAVDTLESATSEHLEEAAQSVRLALESALIQTNPFADRVPPHLMLMPMQFQYETPMGIPFVGEKGLEGGVPDGFIFVLCPDKRCALYTDNETRLKVREWDDTGKKIYDTVGLDDDGEAADGKEERG